MSDRSAIILGAVLLALIGLDVFANGGGAMIFLIQKMVGLIEYLRFWD